MRNLFAIIILLTIATRIIGQPISTNTYQQMIETAEESMDSSDYYNALEWFEKAYKEEKNSDLALAIADISYILKDFKKAERYYDRLVNKDKTGSYTYLRYDLAQSLKAQGKYAVASEEYRVFISETDDSTLKAKAQLELKGIEMLNEYEENIAAVIGFVGKKVNKGQSEYSPVLYTDGSLYYSGYDENKKIEVEDNGESEVAKIYVSKPDEEGIYDKPAELGEHINRTGYHTSNVSFSKDGRQMFFTRQRLLGNKLKESKIYTSYRKDDGWGAAMELKGVNGDYIITHPKIGELYGNEVLFFTSDMEGGYGGYDLYYSTKKSDDEYSLPVNLGERVNTTGDEMTPFYQEGTLYFSSDGHPGLGGLDIFYTSWDGTAWSDVVNIGLNYNTSYDDLYMYFDGGGVNGFLTSNRPDKNKRSLNGKTCCEDIYQFTIRQIVIDLIAGVFDKDGPLAGAAFELTDLSAAETIETQVKTNQTGNKFNFLLDSDREYRAIISREGYYTDTITFNTFGILDDYTVNKKVTLKAKPVAEPVTEIVTINQAIRLNNIYYDLDDDKILPSSEGDLKILEDLLIRYSNMVIELSSHTDSQGGARYNRSLSQRRSESAKKWLTDRGIDSKRIVPKGYGESRILNRCKNGVECSDDEHRFNRRTEFKIIEGPQTIEITRKVVPSEKKK